MIIFSFLYAALTAAIQPAPEAPRAVSAPALTPLTQGEARRVVSTLADLLERDYVFPNTAERYAASLRQKAGAGGYDRHSTNAALADALTADLNAIAPDGHLRVSVDGADGQAGGGGPRLVVRVGGGPASGGASPPTAGTAAPGPIRGRPGDIERAHWIAPGIAFVRLNGFPGSAESIAAVRQFMDNHSEARAIIFDIRTHGGGGLAEMDVLFPYLFERETPLVAMETRGSVAAARGEPEGPTLRRADAPGDVVRRMHTAVPHPSERRLFDARIFLLTSNFTGSAAEHFSLALKRTGRATLIGEATGGAGHYGGRRPIGAGLTAFVPIGRTFDPDTGRGWEGAGVAPDVAVPAERALVEALTRLGIAPDEAERLSAANPTPVVRRRPVPQA